MEQYQPVIMYRECCQLESSMQVEQDFTILKSGFRILLGKPSMQPLVTII